MTGHAIGGQASDQANLVGQAGAGNHDGQVKPKAHRSGQIFSESRRVADTEPGALPPRSTATTLTDLGVRWDRISAVRAMLMLVDREEISRGLAEGLEYKDIALRLGRELQEPVLLRCDDAAILRHNVIKQVPAGCN